MSAKFFNSKSVAVRSSKDSYSECQDLEMVYVPPSIGQVQYFWLSPLPHCCSVWRLIKPSIRGPRPLFLVC